MSADVTRNVDRTLGATVTSSAEPGGVVASIHDVRPVQYPSGHVFFAEGDVGDELYVVISGKVKIGCRADDGRTALFTIMGPSDVFGESSVFDPGPRRATATALVTVCAAPMRRAMVQAWIMRRPGIADELLGMLARRLRRAEHDRSDLIFTDAAGRVAKVLLRLAHQFGVPRDGTIAVTHDLTQQEIAHLVGATRVTVNRVLGEFARRGWIVVDGKTLIITDVERLAHRAR